MNGDKFTVVIPTLWKAHHIHKLLDDLEACDTVGEIVLIDNDNLYHSYIKKPYSKITLISKEKNIYVNPAWNLGVSVAKYNNIALCNDDINFNTSVFDFISGVIDRGVIGECCSNYDPIDRNLPYEIEQIDRRPSGWGCLIFIKKENYIPIPEQMKVSYGDDFLLENVKQGAYILKNLRIDTRMSSTSLFPEFIGISEDDFKYYESIKKPNK